MDYRSISGDHFFSANIGPEKKNKNKNKKQKHKTKNKQNKQNKTKQNKTNKTYKQKTNKQTKRFLNPPMGNMPITEENGPLARRSRQLSQSIVHKMLKLWDFALSLTKA